MAIYKKHVRPFIRNLYYFLFALKLNILSYLLFWIRLKRVSPEQIQRILLVKTERIGDLVLTTPAIRAIRQHFPQSNISMIVNSYTREIIENDPNIDEVIVYDAKSSHRTLKQKIRFIKYLRSRKFDLAIDLGTRNFLLLPVLLIYFSKAKITLGLNNSGRGFLFNIKVKPYAQPRPLAEEVVSILHPLGINTSDMQPKLYLSEEDKNYSDRLFKEMSIGEKDLLVGIHPGGYFETLHWTREGYAKVADHLIQEHGAKVFLVGGPKDKDLAAKIKDLMENKPINLVSQTSLGQLMALISRCQLFIGGSSGPLNIALGFDIPTVSFLGPSIPERWRPQGEKHIVFRKDLPCSPCDSGYCYQKNIECMEGITPQEVIDAADKQLQRFTKE